MYNEQTRSICCALIRNSRKYRRLKAIKNARKATNKSIKARVIITDDEKDLELKENEVEREGVAYEIPQHPTEEVTVRMYPENVSDEEFLQYIESIVDKERHIQEEDPSDQYLLELYDKEKQVFRKDQFPDGWRNPIYPAGKKVQQIKLRVKNLILMELNFGQKM